MSVSFWKKVAGEPQLALWVLRTFHAAFGRLPYLATVIHSYWLANTMYIH